MTDQPKEPPTPADAARAESPADAAAETRASTRALLDFMLRLAQAYLACGEQTALVELFLRRIASARGMRRCRVVAFPTAIFITLNDGQEEVVTLSEGPLSFLRLDQVAEVYTLGEAAERGEVTPQEGLQRLNEVLRRPARFGMPGAIGGHTILAAGLSMVLAPAISNILASAALGLIVGCLKAFSRNRPILSAPLSVVAAALVSALVFFSVNHGLPVDPIDVLVPPLVTFLPGAMLAFGMVELAYGDMVSGASRLMTGFVQLILLAFGLAAGAAIVGVGTDRLLEAKLLYDELPWAPLAGVFLFGLGVFLHFSAPRNALPWILFVLLVAFAAQRAAAAQFGGELSGFFGTLAITPLVYLIQHRFKGPPSMVTFLPGFWLLVPGSVGLLSVTRMLSDRYAGLEGLTSTVFAFASIGLGTLVGASIYKSITEQFGLWRLQVGRASRVKKPRKEQ